jgi:hypothetical protein
MTSPALTWRPYDVGVFRDAENPDCCSYPHCSGRPVLMRGPRDRRMRNLTWRAFCRAHASMYGATLQNRRLLAVTHPR